MTILHTIMVYSSAAKIGDMETIKMLKREGGDYSVEDVSLIDFEYF